MSSGPTVDPGEPSSTDPALNVNSGGFPPVGGLAGNRDGKVTTMETNMVDLSPETQLGDDMHEQGTYGMRQTISPGPGDPVGQSDFYY